MLDITVIGKNSEVSKSYVEKANELCQDIADKYCKGSLTGTVTLVKEKSNRFILKCNFLVPNTPNINIEVRGFDPHSVLSEATENLAKKLRRKSRYLKIHNNASKGRDLDIEDFGLGSSAVLKPIGQHEVGVVSDDLDSDASSSDSALIIAETEIDVPVLSVAEASMQLDFSLNNFKLFRRGDNTPLQLVFKRPDGNIGWIDIEEVK